MYRQRTVSISLTLLMLTLSSFSSIAHAQINAEGAKKISIEESVSQAVSNNFAIYVAQLQNKISIHEYDKARARFDTDLTAEGGYTHDQKKKNSALLPKKNITSYLMAGLEKLFPFGTVTALSYTVARNSYSTNDINPSYASDLAVSLTQPLLQNSFGFIDRAEIQIVKLDVSRADLSTLSTIEEIIANTQRAYYELGFSYDQYHARKEALEQAEDFLHINEEQLKTGLVEKTDLYAAQANVRIKEILLLEAQDTVINKSNDLKFIMNTYPDALLVPHGYAAEYEMNEELAHHLNIAFQYRRDYRAKQIELETHDISVKINTQKLWPSIDLEASFNANGIDRKTTEVLDDVFNSRDSEYFIGGTFSFPIENTYARAEIEQSKLQKAIGIAELRSLEKEIELQIDEYLRRILLEKDKYYKNKEATELQLQKLESESNKFKMGRSSSDLIIRYHDDHIDAKVAESRTMHDYFKAIVTLKQTENILLDEVTLPEQT